MSGGSKTLLVFLLIPFLMGLGHDVYYNYFSNPEKIEQSKSLGIDPSTFRATDMGWVFIEYAPNGFRSLRSATPDVIWKNGIDPILRLPTMVVGLLPFAIALLIIFLNNFLSHNSYTPNSKAYMQGKSSKTNYNRR